MTDEIKEKAYRNICFKYGVLTLCYLIDKYSEEENYEECQIILNAINKLNEKFFKDDILPLPTTFDEKAKRWLKIKLIDKTGTEGDIILNNISYYAEMVEKEIHEMTDGL